MDQKIEVRAGSDLNSGILMSPDDEEATYRKKDKIRSKGYVGHLSETANPTNQLNLITDLDVQPNNVDDAKILEQRLPQMIKKTPQLNEYHADGLYSNPNIDLFMRDNNIKQIQSTSRGRKSTAGIKLYPQPNGEVIVTCDGGQAVLATQKSKSWRVDFDYSICKDCPLKELCNTRIVGIKQGKPRRYTTFMEKAILAHARFNNVKDIPEDRKNIRANVEATVKEAKRGIKNGKLRVRGLLKAKCYLICTAIAINLTRIHRFSTAQIRFWVIIVLRRATSQGLLGQIRFNKN